MSEIIEHIYSVIIWSQYEISDVPAVQLSDVLVNQREITQGLCILSAVSGYHSLSFHSGQDHTHQSFLLPDGREASLPPSGELGGLTQQSVQHTHERPNQCAHMKRLCVWMDD